MQSLSQPVVSSPELLRVVETMVAADIERGGAEYLFCAMLAQLDPGERERALREMRLLAFRASNDAVLGAGWRGRA